MTLENLVDLYDNIDIPYIECRYKFYDIDTKESHDVFVGACSYIDGEIISLDGDNYSLKDPVDDWKLYRETRCGTMLVITLYDDFTKGMSIIKNRLDVTDWYRVANGKLKQGVGKNDDPLYKKSDIDKIWKGVGLDD